MLSASTTTELNEQDVTDLLASQRLHYNHYGRPALPFACLRATGVEIEAADLTDRATFHLLDASGAYGSACLGAGHPAVHDSVRRALTESGYVTDELASLERARLLTRLFGTDGLWRTHFPDDAYHVAGRNSGSEGLELALRLVLESRFDSRRLRYHPGMQRRDTILAFEGAWHGWTGGLLQLLNRRHYKIGLPGQAPVDDYGVRVEHIPFGDTTALREFFTEKGDQLLAVFVEPVQGDAGILVPPPGYLRALAALCRNNDTLLVADEVLTFAKSGEFFAMRDGGPVLTDITVIGKSLGMGAVSTSMVIARRELTARATGAVATSDLRPLTCAVIHDGIDHILSEGLLEHSRDLGQLLAAGLADLVTEFPGIYGEARGIAVMHGLELTDAAAARLTELREHVIRAGVFVEFMAGAGRRSGGLRYVHPTMRIAPPLITTAQQATWILDRLRAGTRAFQLAR